MAHQELTPYQLRWFDDQIHAVAWQQTKFLNWFAGVPGTRVLKDKRTIDGPMVKKVEEGLEEIVTTKWKKMAPGQVAGSPQEANSQVINLTQRNDPLMYLVTKIAIPFNKVDAWKNNKFIRAGDMPQQVLRQAVFPLTNQIDELICYGSDFKTKLSYDRLAGANTTKFYGLFNGFKTFAAGDGLNEKMGTKGDYISTFVNARSKLRLAGLDKGPYYILSDYKTQENAEKGTHRYTAGTKPITAYAAFMGEYKFKQNVVADWIQSINAFAGSAPTTSRYCLTQPFISQQGKKIEAAYVLYISYDFKVLPLYGGTLNGNGEFEWIIIWSGRLHSFDDNAVQVSGDLDLTGT